MDDAYIAAYPELYRNHWWWRAREEILVIKIEELLRDVPHARILDVGCGAGLFFDALQRFGDVEGIEADGATVARSGQWRPRIHHGQLDSSYVPRAPYDLILMLDVLEHLQEPEVLLRRAAELLREGGRILVTVPAFNWLWTKHDDLNHHVRRFTAAGMRSVIEGASLSLIESSYLFPSLVVPKVLVLAVERLLGSSPEVPAIPPAPINRAAQMVLRAEYALGWWVPFGTSLLAIAARAPR